MSDKRRAMIRTLIIVFWVIAWCYFIFDNEGAGHLEWLMLLGLFTLKALTDLMVTTFARPVVPAVVDRLDALAAALDQLAAPPAAVRHRPEPTLDDDVATVPIRRMPDQQTMMLPTVRPAVPTAFNTRYRGSVPGRVVQAVPAMSETPKQAPVSLAEARDTKRRRGRRRRTEIPNFDERMRDFISGAQTPPEDEPDPPQPPGGDA